MLNEIDLSRADLNLLVLFNAVLEEQHVGRAAEPLHPHGIGSQPRSGPAAAAAGIDIGLRQLLPRPGENAFESAWRSAFTELEARPMGSTHYRWRRCRAPAA